MYPSKGIKRQNIGKSRLNPAISPLQKSFESGGLDSM